MAAAAAKQMIGVKLLLCAACLPKLRARVFQLSQDLCYVWARNDHTFTNPIISTSNRPLIISLLVDWAALLDGRTHGLSAQIRGTLQTINHAEMLPMVDTYVIVQVAAAVFLFLCGYVSAMMTRTWSAVTFKHDISTGTAISSSPKSDAQLTAQYATLPTDLAAAAVAGAPVTVAVESDGAKPGTAYLVGGGLGDADLLTVRAKRLIQTADVVLFDRLISDEIRDLASPTATVHVARKTPGNADTAQASLNDTGIAAVKAGKSVVRVKIGDPLLFARGGEELCVYRAHGFEPVLVPGLSSALVAPLLAKIPVTHRGVANQLLISTGRDKGGTFPDLPDYCPTRTLVLLMAVGKLGTLFVSCLAAKGYPSSLPLAIVEDASLPTERQTMTTLGDVSTVHAAKKFKSPAVVIVGWTVCALSDPAIVEAANSLGPKLVRLG